MTRSSTGTVAHHISTINSEHLRRHDVPSRRGYHTERPSCRRTRSTPRSWPTPRSHTRRCAPSVEFAPPPRRRLLGVWSADGCEGAVIRVDERLLCRDARTGLDERSIELHRVSIWNATPNRQREALRAEARARARGRSDVEPDAHPVVDRERRIELLEADRGERALFRDRELRA